MKSTTFLRLALASILGSFLFVGHGCGPWGDCRYSPTEPVHETTLSVSVNAGCPDAANVKIDGEFFATIQPGSSFAKKVTVKKYSITATNSNGEAVWATGTVDIKEGTTNGYVLNCAKVKITAALLPDCFGVVDDADILVDGLRVGKATTFSALVHEVNAGKHTVTARSGSRSWNGDEQLLQWGGSLNATFGCK